MSCRIISCTTEKDWPVLEAILKGREDTGETVDIAVQDILQEVQSRGEAALIEYTKRFDCPQIEGEFSLRLDASEIAKGAALVSGDDLEIIAEAASNIRTFHEAQVEKSWFLTRDDGTILGQQVTPVDRAGLYVPGGKGGDTPLLSSLLMNAIPAQVAGVKELAVVTPPRPDGSINPHILAVAHLLDIDEVYRMGSAWAIGALAYGTENISPVDVIVGPGNIYVTTAKRMLQGRVGIDMIAGPSEVLVIADASANPAWVAADMLSQAEHDALASAVCITDTPFMAEAIQRELDKQCAALPRAELAAKSLKDWSAIVVVPNMRVGLAIANRVAPEHLELCVKEPWVMLPHIKHAGAIFMGSHSPEAVGDYFAGPNHVLPTMGTARFSSALSVQTFCKRSSIVAASSAFVQQHATSIARLARLEGLEAHARSMECRIKKV